MRCGSGDSARFFRLPPGALADKIVGELLVSGSVAERDGLIVPTL
jgi:hypothetical protein